MKQHISCLVFLGVAACATATAPEVNALSVDALKTLPNQTYVLEPGQVAMTFVAKPRLFPAIQGSFSNFGGSVEITDAASSSIAIHAVVDLQSVEIPSEIYENTIRSPAFFDVENHPEAIFEGELDGWRGEGLGAVQGLLTIRGVTRPAQFDIRLNCNGIPACPQSQVGFDGTLEINRSEFGMDRYSGFVKDKVSFMISGTLITAPEHIADAAKP
ncbi:MAG: YceI family protein [Pseudomonadota bacterium]